MKKENARRGFAHSKILMAAAISALFLSSGNVMASTAADDVPVAHEQQQTINVTVTVVDATGEPIIGANVLEKGTTNGGITNLDGVVNLTAAPGAILQVSFVGYQTQEVKAAAKVRVVLKDDTELLDEVVVVGYGTQKKVNLTGAVSNIDVQEAIASRPITDVAKALQGISPGLSITNNQGGVGTESNIKLRGSYGSLSATANNKPLILVDNVEVPSLNLVNPDDIESISVLKDAASASIYGTRAAWGVILITTKQGKKNEKVRITYSNNFAWQTPTEMPEMASAVQQATAIMEVYRRNGQPNGGSSVGFSFDDQFISELQDWENKYGGMSQSELGDIQLGRDVIQRGGKTYWLRPFDPVEMFTHKWTPQQNHNLSVSGGSDKTTFNISLGYMKQEGVMKFNTDQYDRYTLNSNITTQIRDWWKVRTNVMFTRSVNSQPYKYTSGYTDVWYYLLRWPVWYPYGQYEGKDVRSAVTEIKQANRESVTTNYVRANLGTTITPIKGLDINFDYTFSLYNQSQHRAGGIVEAWDMFNADPLNNYNTNVYGSSHNKVIRTSTYRMTNVFKAYGTYNFSLKDDHNFKLMAGFDAETREKLGHYSEGRNMISTTLPEINLTTGDEYARTNGGSYNYNNDFAAAGFFGRINYDYKGKYLLEFNARYDGSSMFPSGKKWGFFPSFSAGWRASEEAFMSWAKPALSDLKIRGSWGTIGNQDVAANSFISTMASGASGWVINGVDQLRLSAPTVVSASLTWEKVTTLDLGFDARFFNGALGASFDWYQRVTSDMHTAGQALPSTFGASVPKINYGELTATGWELALDYSHRFENGLGLNVRGSISHVTEKITKWNAQDNLITGNYEGKKLGEIWGYETEGIFQTEEEVANHADQSLFETGNFTFGVGDIKYKDRDNNKKIDYGKNTVDDHGDLKVIGNSLPDFEYGITLGLDYQGFDFSTYFQGVGSRDYWAYGNVAIPFGMAAADPLFTHQLDYWTPENTDAFYPRPTDHNWQSDGKNFKKQTRFLSDMSYLRCKNITVGYSLPAWLLKKIDFQKLRVFFSAENLFTFDNMHLPVDPETTSWKGAWAFGRSYPYMKTISFGIQATF
ncbi:MAG: TonB-dependent receptor [Mediterranea massiliensis]|nr:TonB-dependent receptor [Mediterranea massiliensis]